MWAYKAAVRMLYLRLGQRVSASLLASSHIYYLLSSLLPFFSPSLALPIPIPFLTFLYIIVSTCFEFVYYIEEGMNTLPFTQIPI
ncbi:hypothetical protein BCR43DRAFT_497149 [Syncephalastrum racemosum]|uniref:Uncharacterized protein n=1 Tax=Syncephalastrum racemosum TaxID=13706 RepID=A0A1X2H572_SYNRA|nr:hypothetical protein BCR43DRAFT_497149 [Syncephalastrum racemosum]